MASRPFHTSSNAISLVTDRPTAWHIFPCDGDVKTGPHNFLKVGPLAIAAMTAMVQCAVHSITDHSHMMRTNTQVQAPVNPVGPMSCQSFAVLHTAHDRTYWPVPLPAS